MARLGIYQKWERLLIKSFFYICKGLVLVHRHFMKPRNVVPNFKKPELNNIMHPETEIELVKWMEDNCYHFDGYSINGNFIYEGFGIEKNGNLYSWYFTERGNRENLKYFSTEKEAVNFAFEQIKTDQTAKTHCIAILKNEDELKSLTSELEKRGVKHRFDKIPYGGKNDIRIRVFVIGCDIKKVQDLKK